jgi:hypothetical protein
LLTCQVGRNHHAIQLCRALDHDHGRAVDKLMLDLQIGELVLEDLIYHLAPESACRQHVRLIQRNDSRLSPGPGQEATHQRDTLNFWFRVNSGVECICPIVFFSFSEIQARGQLPDQHHVGAAADVRLQRRVLDEGVGGEEAGTEVSVGGHLTA